MSWPLVAITCTWVGFFATGLIVGLCINRADARRIPEHPVLRSTAARRSGLPDGFKLRVIEGGNSPYDWKEMGG